MATLATLLPWVYLVQETEPTCTRLCLICLVSVLFALLHCYLAALLPCCLDFALYKKLDLLVRVTALFALIALFVLVQGRQGNWKSSDGTMQLHLLKLRKDSVNMEATYDLVSKSHLSVQTG